MITKETQYRMFAGTKKGDYTGWSRVEVTDQPDMDFWTLDLGNGYFLDRVTKKVRKFFKTREIKLNCIRLERTVEDPDGEYKDIDMSMIFDVEIMISPDSIKFNGKNESFVLLSREPVDWKSFSGDKPDFENNSEENWSSFYS